MLFSLGTETRFPIMKSFLAILISMVAATTASSLESIPARWHHDLSSTYLTDYRNGEHLIISNIWTGTLGHDAVVKYSLEVKVSAWDKPFIATNESADRQHKEVLNVTLHETNNPKEMEAEFEHTVYEDGQTYLKFSGVTILARVN